MLPNDMVLIVAPFPGQHQQIASNRLAGNTAKSWYSAGGIMYRNRKYVLETKPVLAGAERLRDLDFRRRSKKLRVSGRSKEGQKLTRSN
jgi:hypothetical protein